VLIMFSLFKIMRTLLTLGVNSSTPRRHGSRQNNESITNFHVFVECSSLPLVLVMYSLFCPLPCLRGVLEFAPTVTNVPIMLSTRRHGSGHIMRTLLTLGTNSSTPRRYGSGQNNENIPNIRARVEPSVSNALIILSTSMSSWSARVRP
jgi:hypothetical protein